MAMSIRGQMSVISYQKAAVFWFVLLFSFSARAESFDSWKEDFAVEAQEAGVAPELLQKVLPELSLNEDVIELDRKQPESRMSFDTYVRRVVSDSRIEKGRLLKADYPETLWKVSKQYGVPPAVIVALWGVESSYGASYGNYNIFESLATLAYEGRRARFFRKELIEAFKVVQEEKMDPWKLVGSWAGAMGQCQFMPSTFRAYAADFDGDGRRDIWENVPDVFASIASYLKAEGWARDLKWGREVHLTRPVPAELIGLEIKHDLAFWQKAGVRTLSKKHLPNQKVEASLIQPDGAGGRSFLVYDNFRALMRWNRSTYFAASVGLLANRIDGGK